MKATGTMAAPRSGPLHADVSEALNRFERTQEASERRFNEVRDTVTRFATEIPAIQSNIAALASEVRHLAETVSNRGRINIPYVMAMIAVFALLGPVLWGVVTGYTEGRVGAVSKDIGQITVQMQAITAQLDRNVTAGVVRDQKIGELTQISSANAAAVSSLTTQGQRVSEMAIQSAQTDTESKQDRSQLNDRAKRLERALSDETAARREQLAAVNILLGEVETQFHAVSNQRNTDQVSQHRLNALLWEQVFKGTRYPDQAFYPSSLFQNRNGGASPVTRQRLPD